MKDPSDRPKDRTPPASNTPVPFPATNRPDARLQQQTQDIVYSYLLEIVRAWPPDEVIQEFRKLFIEPGGGVSNEEALTAITELVKANQEQDFCYTVKRSCYILFNNWEANRQQKYIPKLVSLFRDESIQQKALSPVLQRVRAWLKIFVEADDFKDLQVFTSKYEPDLTADRMSRWSDRYTAYLLVPQYSNPENPTEQREVARVVSQRLKDRFKLDLALYTTRSQLIRYQNEDIPNPTIFGSDVLRVIKTMVNPRGNYSYTSLARRFVKQTEHQTYFNYKANLQKYLLLSWESHQFSALLKERLEDRLQKLYPRQNQDLITDALRLRTCNRTINILTTENKWEPSPLFVWMMSGGNPLLLTIALLRLVMISPNSRLHLETCIAQLIRYYEEFPEDECQWVIQFFELFKIACAIHAEDVEYSLIELDRQDRANPSQANAAVTSADGLRSGDRVRVFAQLRFDRSRLASLALTEEEAAQITNILSV